MCCVFVCVSSWSQLSGVFLGAKIGRGVVCIMYSQRYVLCESLEVDVCTVLYCASITAPSHPIVPAACRELVPGVKHCYVGERMVTY